MIQIIVALIAAAATIAAAAFQYAASVKALSAKREQNVAAAPGGPAAKSSQPEVTREVEQRPLKEQVPKSVRNLVYWYFLGGIVTIAVAVFAVVNADMAMSMNALVIIPASSLLLALLRPIEAAYAALFVTIATAASYAGCAISNAMHLPNRQPIRLGDMPSILGIYALNVVIVAGLDYWRWKSPLRKRSSVNHRTTG